MGCDIHVHIEVEIGCKWEHYSAPTIQRNSRLFVAMGGMDSDRFEAICAPKGLPSNISAVTSIDFARDRYHHSSWFDLKQIKELFKWGKKEGFRGAEYDKTGDWWFESVFGYLFQNAIYSGVFPQGVSDVRMVFWFDN